MSSEEKLEIPAHIDGLDVISIADDAINYGGAKETVVPDTVRFIADNAFKESYSLEDIYLTKNVSYIGKSAFKDSKDLTIHAPTDSYAHTFATENKINFKDHKIKNNTVNFFHYYCYIVYDFKEYTIFVF